MGAIVRFPEERDRRRSGRPSRCQAETERAVAELQAKWMERWSDPVALMLRLQEVLDDHRAHLTVAVVAALLQLVLKISRPLGPWQ